MTWECVIGLEVHVQLGTSTKMFCAAANSYGEPPNTLVDPYTLGLPGALPGAQRRGGAPRHAGRAGTRLHGASGEHLRPEALLLSRPAEGLPDLPVRGAAGHEGRGEHRVAGAGADQHRCHPAAPRGRCRQVAARPAAGPHRGGPQPCRRAARGDRERTGHAERRRGARVPHAAAAAAGVCRGVGVQHGEGHAASGCQRLRAPAGRAEVRRQGGGEEPQQLRQRGARHRGGTREADRDTGGRGPDRPGDAPLQREHRHHQGAAVEGGEPRLPLLPRSRPPAAGAGAALDRRAARDAAGTAGGEAGAVCQRTRACRRTTRRR